MVVVTKANRKPMRGKWPPEARRVRSILDGLEDLYPEVDCELDRGSPFQLLCATILSAQCTDERVNRVTPELFRRFPDAEAMSGAGLPELETIIRSTGFFRQKAKNLKATATALRERHGGEPPDFFTAGGMSSAIAIVEAIKKAGGTDTEKLIAAMEDMSFESPKGKMTFRKQDHQALQSMYHFKVRVDPALAWAALDLVSEMKIDDMQIPIRNKR